MIRLNLKSIIGSTHIIALSFLLSLSFGPVDKPFIIFNASVIPTGSYLVSLFTHLLYYFILIYTGS